MPWQSLTDGVTALIDINEAKGKWNHPSCPVSAQQTPCCSWSTGTDNNHSVFPAAVLFPAVYPESPSDHLTKHSTAFLVLNMLRSDLPRLVLIYLTFSAVLYLCFPRKGRLKKKGCTYCFRFTRHRNSVDNHGELSTEYH